MVMGMVEMLVDLMSGLIGVFGERIFMSLVMSMLLVVEKLNVMMLSRMILMVVGVRKLLFVMVMLMFVLRKIVSMLMILFCVDCINCVVMLYL